ncbi:hypothetical protein GCM10007160_16800 [Litchfieldella qijiaojingensis]|uniref:Uncharacterized protein n=1 Tax=Litchfieldella qijiaojingensis TaxID=980347 RepID=A0ABQ2YN90_9GAMM|nr:hypothetical protein [Halomonas qijiaojingensis]GGX90003.1 hypothetical protein GCM10007160_16800 [Halomonas qijiaojingensis]
MSIDHNARYKAAFLAKFERALADQPEWIRERAVLGATNPGQMGSTFYPDTGKWEFRDADGNVLEAPKAAPTQRRAGMSEQDMRVIAKGLGNALAERDARIDELEATIRGLAKKVGLLSQRMKEGAK